MYKVRTRSGTTYQYIKSWNKSDLDEDFIEFQQGNSSGVFENVVILPKSEIISISK